MSAAASIPERRTVITGGALVPDLVFDEATHRYARNGVTLPGITRILRDLGMVDVSGFTDAHREFGINRHLVTQLDDEGDLDESTVTPDLLPTLHGWRAWRKESGFTPTHCEVWVHSAFGYCTIVDRIGYFERAPEEIVLINIKGPADLPSYAIQTAAEQIAFEEVSGQKVAHRLGVHISRDGTTRAKAYTNPKDKPTWLACMSVWAWRRSNGL